MKKKDPFNAEKTYRLPRPSSSDLRGKQSVRATFRLSKTAVETISILAVQLGIKQKSLFDHLIEDRETLNLIARRLDPNILQDTPRVQKTYVLNRRTLHCLERAARQYDTPRDALVEYSIKRLLPVIQRELAKHRERKELIAETESLAADGRSLLRRILSTVGDDDPFSIEFQSAMQALLTAQRRMAEVVEKGEELEAFLSAIEKQ